jgi:hypothetical protein
MTESLGLVHFIDSAISYYTPKELSTITNDIQNAQNIASSSEAIVPNQCIPDAYVFESIASEKFNEKNFFRDYFKYAYASTGLALYYIIGNIVSLYVYYGYPIQDPSQKYGQGCVTSNDALKLDASDPPKCFIRAQKNKFFFNLFDIYGNVNVGISGQF